MFYFEFNLFHELILLHYYYLHRKLYQTVSIPLLFIFLNDIKVYMFQCFDEKSIKKVYSVFYVVLYTIFLKKYDFFKIQYQFI